MYQLSGQGGHVSAHGYPPNGVLVGANFAENPAPVRTSEDSVRTFRSGPVMGRPAPLLDVLQARKQSLGISPQNVVTVHVRQAL